ncbi:kinase-like domain-containing protein [Armillaria novae-zelandiae]|uniref:Kinase-like domain-containing protein n=1 Tax=Armillaria novae-zelandiae TaxID=153914 RepID=A0AA39P5E3_9AGAR|nr:kinase-like domain-containing protein [Armillaria novae-zelandiae]
MDDAEIPQTNKMYIPNKSERQEGETFWVSHQPFLASRGYMLRPRYHPDWIPSWKSNPHPRGFYEDQHVIHDRNAWRIIDAIRLSDGCKVVLKAVSLLGDDYELTIAHFLSHPALRDDSRNRAIPLLDVVYLPGVKDVALIVMPMFRCFLTPSFHCRIEFIELFRQLLGGLEFMHIFNIAHRDISVNNVLMDHRRVMPKGYHFGLRFSHDGIEINLPTERRCLAGPVDYYFIDFQYSQCFPEGHDKALVSGIVGQRVPEMKNSNDVCYNPFKADVYQLGTTMLDEFETYTGLDDFKPLLHSMVSVDPDKRPSASDALAQFEAIVSRSSKVSMTWRIWSNTFCDQWIPWFWNRFLYFVFPPCRPFV